MHRLALALSLLAPPALSAQAERRCPVATRTIARGAVVARADIGEGASPLCPSVPIPTDSLPGHRARRLIRAGEPLRAPAIAPAPLVAEGDSVELRVVEGGVHLSLRGTVAAPALLGERVWVRLGPKRRLQGVVAARGLVVAD